MNNDDINEYLPSIFNPRAVKKERRDFTLTQNSVVSRCSLSLKRPSNVKKALHKSFPPAGKENTHKNSSFPINNLPSNKNEKNLPVITDSLFSFSLTQEVRSVNVTGKENSRNDLDSPKPKAKTPKQKTIEEISIGFSAIDDIITEKEDFNSSPLSFGDIVPLPKVIEVNNNDSYETLIAISSDTDLNDDDDDNNIDNTLSTIVYDVTENLPQKIPVVNVSFEVMNCESLNISTNNTNIKNISVTSRNNVMNVDCEVEECMRVEDDVIEVSSEDESPPKKRATVNLEIKKKTPTSNPIDNSKVLILNTNAIQRLSHVIVQPPNYKLVKRKISDRDKLQQKCLLAGDGKVCSKSLKQKRIDDFLVGVQNGDVGASGNGVVMSRVSGADGKCDRTSLKPARREALSPRARALAASRPATVKGSASRNASEGSSSKKHIDSIQFNLPPKSTSARSSTVQKNIPYYKFVAGTNFVVDAFSYGDIPQVNHYFLTHFHSDHYSGLKKSFNKTLFCSKITAELCITRLGVNPKHIKVISVDESFTVENVDVLAVDANHCPGALMLVFSLPNGKTLLHTGDFRASPYMESYPIFWNKDIDTVYLDTTYCNPRYDFPTQEQCLEMALYILRQKKLALEKTSKKFSSVLIVCGTYTIGKEKFFMGLARRVGCSVWACPEKDKVLQAVEGRSFGAQPPAACQLHVVPMRDLTHEKLRAYLDSLQGAYAEVVAFKPSGWENGNNSCIERDLVTIHGIPYSEHSSFSEMVRFVKFLQPKQVVPTVDISGGTKAVQKHFPCPLVTKDPGGQNQTKLTDFLIHNQPHVPAVT